MATKDKIEGMVDGKPLEVWKILDDMDKAIEQVIDKTIETLMKDGQPSTRKGVELPEAMEIVDERLRKTFDYQRAFRLNKP